MATLAPPRPNLPRAAPWLCAVLVAGCSPALDWREFKPEGAAALTVLMPCKAVLQQRQVALAGDAVALRLHVCDAAGRSWAIAVADVADPARVPAALASLKTAAAANVGATASQELPLAVPGATPQPASARLLAQGRRPDGTEVFAELAVFSRGTVVVQATLLGRARAASDAETFFASLRFVP